MPYCTDCGKQISENKFEKNEGQSDVCFHTNLSLDTLERCAYCNSLSNVYCIKCGRPLCKKHASNFYFGDYFCKKCSKKEGKCWIFFLILFEIVIIGTQIINIIYEGLWGIGLLVIGGTLLLFGGMIAFIIWLQNYVWKR